MDKRILFESAKDGSSQIWVQDFDASTGALTGEARKVTSISTEASGGTWSPDGKSILFVSSVYPDCNDDACNKQRDEDESQVEGEGEDLHPADVSSLDQLLRRQVQPPVPGRRLKVELRAISRLATTMFRRSRSEVRISIRSRPTAKRSPTPATSTKFRRRARTATSLLCRSLAERRRRSRRTLAATRTPLYSPDGKYIAYRAQLRGGYESDRFRLMLYERATGKITDVAPNFDRWVDSMAWSPDSKTIYFTAEQRRRSADLQA